VIRGPNIKPVPIADPLPDTLEVQVLLKVGDNITTDHIMPAGAEILPLRSNIPAISEYVFARVDPDFVSRAKSCESGALVGGVNYGQGSSREHAALAPMYLGVKAVIAQSYSRIHHVNLVNMGMLPLEFVNGEDYEHIEQGDTLQIAGIQEALEGKSELSVQNRSQHTSYEMRVHLTERQRRVLLAGGLLNDYRTGEDDA
jgi:aconitate hydratase